MNFPEQYAKLGPRQVDLIKLLSGHDDGLKIGLTSKNERTLRSLEEKGIIENVKVGEHWDDQKYFLRGPKLLKECKVCHERRPYDGFRKSTSHVDGRETTCKDCQGAKRALERKIIEGYHQQKELTNE